ncbi:MAG: GntR family transcriptional regulator [Pseudonocardia sp.]|nr:GntR family transcriptional regulator [Pseudonocardia sp.]
MHGAPHPATIGGAAPEPRAYRRIADDIRSRFGDVPASAGTELPSARELAHAYGVSTALVQLSLQILAREGVTSRPGHGRPWRIDEKYVPRAADPTRPDEPGRSDLPDDPDGPDTPDEPDTPDGPGDRGGPAPAGPSRPPAPEEMTARGVAEASAGAAVSTCEPGASSRDESAARPPAHEDSGPADRGQALAGLIRAQRGHPAGSLPRPPAETDRVAEPLPTELPPDPAQPQTPRDLETTPL